jgi:putative transposase
MGMRFPVIIHALLDAWEHVTPLLAFSPEVRRVIYTMNAIEALNGRLRKAIKTKGHFPVGRDRLRFGRKRACDVC